MRAPMSKHAEEPLIGFDPEVAMKVLRAKVSLKKDREIYLNLLMELANGGSLRTYFKKTGLQWTDITSIYYGATGVYDLMEGAYRSGETYLALVREEEADRRAIEGVPSKEKRKYSDRLLELKLKAQNPAKYSDKKEVNHTGMVVNFDIQGVVRDPVEEETVYEMPKEEDDDGN